MSEVSAGLRQIDVCRKLGVSRVTLWRMIRDQKFPKPIPVTDRVAIWPESEVTAWLDRRREGAA